jgi:hypothetical protein
MGARPSSFKKGGGRLNNVAATIMGIEFTGDELVYQKGQSGFERVEFTPGKVKKEGGGVKDKFHTLNALVSLRVDGATEDTIEPMFAGGADDFAISDDGTTIWDAAYDTPEAAAEAAEDPANKVKELGANTKFANFITSLCEAGFPETNLPEDRICYEATVGTRVQIIQREDPAMKGKKRVDKATKKEYAYTFTAVDDVLALPDAEAPAAPAAKASAKAAPKAAAKPAAGKKVAAPVAEPELEESDLDAETTLALVEALGKKSPMKVGDLSMWVLKNRMKHPQREAIRSRIVDGTFLATQDGWTYDKTGKTVTLAE